MQDFENPDAVNPFVKTTQIIVMALVFGVFGFLMVAMMIGHRDQAREWGPLGMVAAGLAPISIVTGRWFASVFLKQVKAQLLGTAEGAASSATDEEHVTFARSLQTTTIIICGAIEGAAMVNVVVVLMSGHQINLFAALGLLVVIGLHFPTQARAENWIANQRQQLEEERQVKSF